MKTVIITLSILVLGLIVSGDSFAWKDTKISKAVPLPKNIEIIPPSPDLPKELAAFSGRWEGKWDGDMESVLIVEKIDSKEAEVIYSWGRSSTWYLIVPGFKRYKGKIILGSNPKIEFGPLTFEIGEDLKTINGTLRDSSRLSKIKMQKIEED